MTSITLGKPAAYRITVQGCLSSSWSDQFGGMAITNEVDAEESSLTVLSGRLVDQAALFGILNGLYGLGFALLSVECLEVDRAA
jgi:hypothetical protein